MKGVVKIKKNNVSHPLNKSKKWLVFTGYGAFIWSIVFGLIHVYWAVGGTAGFDGKSMSEVLFLINLVAIVLCLVAAILALGLVQSWGRRIPSWILLTAAWIACVVLGLRGGVGIIQSMLQLDQIPLLLIIVEPFFLLGGTLYGFVAYLYIYTSDNRKKVKSNGINIG